MGYAEIAAQIIWINFVSTFYEIGANNFKRICVSSVVMQDVANLTQHCTWWINIYNVDFVQHAMKKNILKLICQNIFNVGEVREETSWPTSSCLSRQYSSYRSGHPPWFWKVAGLATTLWYSSGISSPGLVDSNMFPRAHEQTKTSLRQRVQSLRLCCGHPPMFPQEYWFDFELKSVI